MTQISALGTNYGKIEYLALFWISLLQKVTLAFLNKKCQKLY